MYLHLYVCVCVAQCSLFFFTIWLKQKMKKLHIKTFFDRLHVPNLTYTRNTMKSIITKYMLQKKNKKRINKFIKLFLAIFHSSIPFFFLYPQNVCILFRKKYFNEKYESNKCVCVCVCVCV